MKVRPRTQVMNNALRRALWWHGNGTEYAGDPEQCPMADYACCREHLEINGRGMDEDLYYDWRCAVERWQEQHAT